MLYAGVILAPTLRADALTALGDLKTIVNSAAGQINNPPSSNGFWTPPPGVMSTADLINNITTTILKDNYDLVLNQAQWLKVTSDDPTVIPTNLTETGLDEPYIEYVNAIPTLSTACISLGRSWHRDMNSPVHDALGGLQQGMNTFSTSLLSAGLIHSNSTLRTIRASGTLEDAQQAWSRILNLPGSSHSASKRDQTRRRNQKRHTRAVPDGHTLVRVTFEEAQAEISRTARGPHQIRAIRPGLFTHQQLWGPKKRHSNEGQSRRDNAIAQLRENGRRIGARFQG